MARKNKNQWDEWEVEIINMIYDETAWTSLNHTHWMNTSAAARSDSIQKNLPAQSRCVCFYAFVC